MCLHPMYVYNDTDVCKKDVESRHLELGNVVTVDNLGVNV
jgi:hypothetical protein